MSTTSAISNVEIWFTLGALVLTVGAGLLLFPAIRSALKEDQANTSPDPRGESSEH